MIDIKDVSKIISESNGVVRTVEKIATLALTPPVSGFESSSPAGISTFKSFIVMRCW